jgi:hypothetical protein
MAQRLGGYSVSLFYRNEAGAVVLVEEPEALVAVEAVPSNLLEVGKAHCRE